MCSLPEAGMQTEIAKITSKGQVTVPKRVRDRLGLRTGDEIEFLPQDGQYGVRKLMRVSPFKRYQGYLKHLGGEDPDALVDAIRGR
jgi:antitoxin PrlF